MDQLKRSVDKFCCCVAILSTVCTATQENQAKITQLLGILTVMHIDLWQLPQVYMHKWLILG